MTQKELQEIEGRCARADRADCPGGEPYLGDDVLALIAEVRRLRELVDDETPIYVTHDELQKLQRMKNKAMTDFMNALSAIEPKPE